VAVLVCHNIPTNDTRGEIPATLLTELSDIFSDTKTEAARIAAISVLARCWNNYGAAAKPEKENTKINVSQNKQ
jgi:hypothetical protein